MDKNLLNQVKKICQLYNIKPAKDKGQNFLVDSVVLNDIVSAAGLNSSDIVLEVGPGLGILTEELISRVKRVVSVELDKKLYSFLKTQFISAKNLELVNEDILKFDPAYYQLSPTTYKLVANLPYNITSSFFKKFLTLGNKPSEITVLVQKEVAQRICAKPGGISLLSLSVQLYSSPEIVRLVPAGSFWPAPAVDSAVLKLSSVKSQADVDKTLDGVSEKKFWQIAHIGFSAKRKQLHNNLSSGLKISSGQAVNVLKKANFDPKIRAQNLSLADWVRLAKQL